MYYFYSSILMSQVYSKTSVKYFSIIIVQSIILSYILLSGITYAQKYDPRVLQDQISKETNDTIRINLIIRYMMIYGTGQDFKRFSNEIQELSVKNNYRPGLIYHRFYEGVILSDNNKFDEAIDKFKSCIEGLDSLGIVQSSMSPLGLIRTLFDFACEQTEKFEYYSDKLVFYKKNGPVENTANCYFGIAGYYLYLADYDKAIEYYLRAGEVYQSFDSIGYASVLGEIGSAYLGWGNFEKAEEYLKSGLKESISLSRADDIIFCYNNLSELYLIRQDYRQALQNSRDLANFLPTVGAEYTAINFVNIAAIHLHLNDLDSALYYLKAAENIRQHNGVLMVAPYGNLEIDYYYYLYFIAAGDQQQGLKSLKAALQEAQQSKYLPLVLKYTNELQSYLLKRGDSLQSLHYLIQYHDIQDSLIRMNTKARIATFEIEQQAQVKKNEIEKLQAQKEKQRNYFLFGGILLLLVVFAAISRTRYKRKRDNEQLKTEFNKQLAQAETKALRAQMNPHFIFNCLNSINSYVIGQEFEKASEYLIKFSKLIRLILDNSRSETITIEKELETLKLYVLLESARFDNKFSCFYHIAEDVNIDSIMIPPMLLQPFVENAIWHGLMQKDGKGTITIEIKKENEEFLKISIIDNGIGRERAAELKSKTATHKSHGLKVTSQRIEMMNKLNSSAAQVNIFDLKDETGKAAGTRVELIIPY